MLRSGQNDQPVSVIARYIRRAREERELARSAVRPGELHAHLALARHYELLVELAHAPQTVGGSAFDDENANYIMSSQKLFPFHQQRGLASAWR